MKKIQRCYLIYRRIADDATIPVKSRRRHFIQAVGAEEDLDVSKNCANSYFSMCKARAEGRDPYASHRAWNKKNQKSTDSVPATVALDEPKASQDVNTDDNKRWQVVYREDRKVVDAFTTRAKAAKYNREMKAKGEDTVMIDALKESQQASA